MSNPNSNHSESWIIRSDSEDGWWSNEDGWVEDTNDATVFTLDERNNFNLPLSTKSDAKWVDALRESRPINPNTNCLEGMRCPKCGSYGPFNIGVFASAIVRDDGVDNVTDLEWDKNSPCVCRECCHDSDVSEFTE